MVGLIFYYRKQKVIINIENEEEYHDDMASSFPLINQDVLNNMLIQTTGEFDNVFIYHNGEVDSIAFLETKHREDFVKESLQFSNYNLYLVHLN